LTAPTPLVNEAKRAQSQWAYCGAAAAGINPQVIALLSFQKEKAQLQSTL